MSDSKDDYGAICCSEIESFRKDYIHQDHRIYYQQIFFLWGQIKATFVTTAHAMWMNRKPIYVTSLPTFHPWRCKQRLRRCFVVLSYECNTLVHTSETFYKNMHYNSLLWMSQDSTVGMPTGYGLDDAGVRVRVPVGSRILSSPRSSNRLWGPPSLLSNGCRGSSPRVKATGAWSWLLTSS
jgi:hypothetical protein